MMRSIKFCLALAGLLSVCSVTAQQRDPPSDTSTVVSRDIQSATPTEIIVTGRQPGPPMWKVSNGDNTLWIFAYLSPIPEGIIWESDRVQAVIAQSEVYLTMPQTRAKISRLVLANPINWIRGYRMARRLSRNADGATLEDVLPADVYQRFAALQSRYFPDDEDILEFRPMFAGDVMTGRITRQAGLTSGEDVIKRVERMVRRKRNIETVEVEAEVMLEGGFNDLAARVEKLLDGFDAETEAACLESQITRMESDLDEMKTRADSWARGYVDEFRNIPAPAELHAACDILLASSDEAGLMEDIEAKVDQQWLNAAEMALTSNTTSFAILDIYELLRHDGLLAQLQVKGFVVKAP